MSFVTKGGVASSPMTGLIGHLAGWVGATGYGASTTAEEVARGWDGNGKTVLITGANTGAFAAAVVTQLAWKCACHWCDALGRMAA